MAGERDGGVRPCSEGLLTPPLRVQGSRQTNEITASVKATSILEARSCQAVKIQSL